MSERSARALRRAAVLGLALLGAPLAATPAAATHLGQLVVTAIPFDLDVAQAAVDTSNAPPPQSDAAIPDYTGYVTDAAGVMDEPTRAKLEAFLDQLQKKTNVQFAVLTVKTTAPLTPSEYKERVFQRWKIGEKGKDNGLLMLVALDERQVRFETGYGLEGTLPDGLQSRIFRREMAPRFQAGDYPGGITQGVLACAARIAAEHGVTLEWDGSELRYDEAPGGSQGRPNPLVVAIVVFFVLVFVILAIGSSGRRYRSRRGYDDWSSGWGGFGGGWGGGGGGGGGGGFGGFGGGSSGGGGGGGSW